MSICCKLPTNLKSYLFFSLCVLFLSGCQGIYKSQASINTSNYGSYYLWIKSLSTDELNAEIQLQQEQSKQGNEQAEMQLLILHSLPNSPIHNPYTAKSKLNQHELVYDSPKFNVTDFAFIVMLKDQLNQQLLVLNKLILNEKFSLETQKQVELQQQSIELLENQSKKLKEQIKQLKNIERSINEHG